MPSLQVVRGRSSCSSGKGRSHQGPVKYGFSLVKGKANHPMEDYHVAKFVQIQGHELGLFAIYDGHLGDSVPAYLQKNLFNNILKDVSWFEMSFYMFEYFPFWIWNEFLHICIFSFMIILNMIIFLVMAYFFVANSFCRKSIIPSYFPLNIAGNFISLKEKEIKMSRKCVNLYFLKIIAGGVLDWSQQVHFQSLWENRPSNSLAQSWLGTRWINGCHSDSDKWAEAMDCKCWRFTCSSCKKRTGDTDDNWSWAKHWAG